MNQAEDGMSEHKEQDLDRIKRGQMAQRSRIEPNINGEKNVTIMMPNSYTHKLLTTPIVINEPSSNS